MNIERGEIFILNCCKLGLMKLKCIDVKKNKSDSEISIYFFANLTNKEIPKYEFTNLFISKMIGTKQLRKNYLSY